ncbi:MAG: hypothetical protein KDC33_06670 [Thermoleophilia bacterium]|nr:hypothetical protein [Thermoleophilia bacterium]
MSLPRFALAGAVAACACAAPAPAQGRLSLIYDTDAVVRYLAAPDAGPGLSPTRGALRQAPGPGGMFTQGHPGPTLVAKVGGRELAGMSARRMAATLRARIRHGTDGAASHLVAVDEVDAAYADARPPVVRRGARLPRVRAAWAGSRFTRAMRLLDRPSPYGGTWASRVHVYLAPGVHSSIAAGRGPLRNLGRDGKPHLRSWRAVMPGLALAGGVHLQMYHARGGVRTAFTAAEWRRVPGAVTGLLRRAGGGSSRLHFVFSSTGTPAGATRCGDAQACMWGLAESTPAGRAVLANGPGLYRIDADARGWLREFNRRFG